MPGTVTFIPWVRNGLCGAACAQMALSARALRPTTDDEQKHIWKDIQALTTGPTSTAKCCSSIISNFANMIREVRRGAKCAVCWGTFPTAMEAVLVDGLDAGQVALTETDDQDDANGAIRACLRRGGVPIVLVRKGKHWVVVGNWANGGTKPVTVFDPADEEPEGMTVGRWNARMMVAVDFGRYDGKYVVVTVG